MRPLISVEKNRECFTGKKRVCAFLCVCTHVFQLERTVCVNKALSWAPIKPFSTQCLSLSETPSDGNLLLLRQFNVPVISWWKKSERKVWKGLYSFMFQTLCAHTFDKSHTLLAALQWNQCSWFPPLCAASHSAKSFLWSNTTSCSATSDTDASTVQLLCSGVEVHFHCIQSP